MSLPNDKYGRSISIAEDNGRTVYSVHNLDGSSAFTIGFPKNHELDDVYSSIEAMAPEGWIDAPT